MLTDMKKIVSFLACLALVFVAGVLMSARNRQVTFFMVGDSTMADKTELIASPERGWGQLFPTFLKGNIVVQNHAKNGRSTLNFQTEGRWAEVISRVQKGDIMVIEFGHNDSKQSDPNRYASIEDYGKNLTKMVAEARAHGVNVILATPISRRSFENGVLVDKHGGYPDEMRRVAKVTHTPLVDMTRLTMNWLEELGDDPSKAYFMNVPAGECTKFPEGKIDNTHLRENGAVAVGRMFAEEVVKQHIKPLCKYINLNATEPVYTLPCGIK